MQKGYRAIVVIGAVLLCTAALQSQRHGSVGAPENAHQSPQPSFPESSEGCETGCSTANHPVEPLTHGEYLSHLRNFATQKGHAKTKALDALLFHGAATSAFMTELGTPNLHADDLAFLTRELSKTRARMSLRVVDQDGVVRGLIDDARLPIGQKSHLHLQVAEDLPPVEVSGTIHRTGLNYLWTRM